MALQLNRQFIRKLPKSAMLLCILCVLLPPLLDDYSQYYINEMSWFFLLFPCFIFSYYLGFTGGLTAAIIANIYHLAWYFNEKYMNNEEVLDTALTLHVGVIIISFLCSVGVGILSEKLKEKQIQLQNLNKKLKQMAMHDSLTGLPNRTYFMGLLRESMNSNELVTLMFIDLDGFKSVNDTYGHEEGDRLLKEVATKLNHFVDGSTIVSRLGGDEFVVLIKGEDQDLSLHKANGILSTLQMKIQDLSISASIGIAFYQNEYTPSALLKHADMAMYQAKSAGKNSIFYFDHAGH